MNTTVSTPAYVEPVIRSVRVAVTPARAFEVFTTGIGRWWIPTHSILASKSPQASVTIEPRVGGRWYERGEDGSESDWGSVLAWEPPRRLVLGWQLDAQWDFDPALVTEVEVRFDAEPGGGTNVDARASLPRALRQRRGGGAIRACLGRRLVGAA